MLKVSLAVCSPLFQVLLVFKICIPARTEHSTAQKCERSIIQEPFSSHIQRLCLCSMLHSLNCYCAPCPLSAFFKSIKRGTWKKYVKGKDVLQMFSCSLSCLSHYSAERYKPKQPQKFSDRNMRSMMSRFALPSVT